MKSQKWAELSSSLVFLSIADLSCWIVTRDKRQVCLLVASIMLHFAMDGARVPLLFPLSEPASQPTWLRWAFAASSVLLMTLTGPVGRAVAKLARKRFRLEAESNQAVGQGQQDLQVG